jgi:type I restriction enzyme S subunit
MTEAPTNLMVPTYPRSVQPGIPRLSAAPEGWSTRRFGELLKVVQRPVRMTDDGEYDLVTVKRSRGGIESRGRFRGKDISVKSQFALDGGDFLISKRQIVHGACAVVPEEFAGSIVSNEYSVLRCKPGLDLGFLRYLSHSVYFQQTCFHSSIGVHVEKMIFKLEDWLKFRVNVPPLEEQKRIAAGFDAVDAKLTALREKADGLRQFKTGLMQKLFSQELRFTREDGTDFPDWEDGRLADVAQIFGGGTPDSNVPEYWNGDIPWFTPTEIKTKYLQNSVRRISDLGLKNSSAKMLPPGSLILSTRATVGEVGISSRPCSTNQGFQSLVVHDGQYNEFWYYWIRAHKHKFLRNAAGSTFLEIGKSEVQKLDVSTPCFDEQRKIADALSALDAKIDAVTDQITHMETFKKGLLQKMFV